MPLYDYRWAAAHGVALASLKNIETELNPHNYRAAGGMWKPVSIASVPVDPFPVRTRLMDGTERGDGQINHALDMILATFALKYVLDTYLASGAAVSAAMTLYTRRHELAAYARYSCYLILPRPGEDMEYLRQNLFRVRFRFTHLVAL